MERQASSCIPGTPKSTYPQIFNGKEDEVRFKSTVDALAPT
eukprot:CAMPEP_0204117668 /NCGR_PEP_ID=MMETSP0361-20130328/6111_1 /ASSEMBLY_ACC=CAM_ASM_000343 /TAXON_ID=268821 /ORGANISM="Scrippsiella Hangoei, Strain SHTV-5" /LENGTH=40 /DNA_ID= /DNA_START= /DNA_END= /DNA_ORIENTATION=